MDDSRDLDQLARTLARLEREVQLARGELTQLRDRSNAARAAGTGAPAPEAPAAQARAADAPAPAAAPPPRRDAPPRPRAPQAELASGLSFEDLIGRYGALALAGLTIIMGAGALVSWALHQGLLTPVVRIVLGALLAAALAGAGLTLRARDSRQYGHTLLALSLAVVHVVAWGAGPQLGLVPAWVSLTIADAASLALSILALRDDSEQLFAVGMGGALLAPFVQSSGVERFLILAAYGFVVSTAAMRTIGGRPWKLAASLVVLAAFAYSLALTGYHDGAPWLNRELSTGFVLVLSAAALILARAPLRPWMALALVAIGAVTGGVLQPHGDTALAMLANAPDLLVVAIAGTGLAMWAARALPARSEWWSAGALALPLMFLARVMFELMPRRGGDLGGAVHASVAGLWMLAFAAAAMGERAERRGALLAAAGVVATWATVLAVDGWPSAVPAACAVVAIVTAWVARRESQPLVLIATAVAAAYGFAQGMMRLFEVQGFGVPFTSQPTVALAAGMAGLLVAVRLVPDLVENVSGNGMSLPDVAWAAFVTGCFLWWRTELSRAFNADAAMFLLIVYYAACGVTILWRGRATGSRGLRQVGLALSVWAALVALGGAFAVQQIALRVGSYLAVGAFLLGVAWWYRAAGATANAPASDAPVAR